MILSCLSESSSWITELWKTELNKIVFLKSWVSYERSCASLKAMVLSIIQYSDVDYHEQEVA